MKFDIIIGNPPYQEQKPGNRKTQPLWHKFVDKSLDDLIEAGFLVMVHPSGWRNIDGRFKAIQKRIKSKTISNLKLHTFKQGQEIFDAAISFDFYCLNNVNNINYKTEILTTNNITEYINISELEFISDENIEFIQSLVAKNNQEKIKIIADSTYHTQKDFVIKYKDNEHVYPVVYTVKSPTKGSIPTFWYTNKNNKHFGIPKLIWANGASGVTIDDKGLYGLTQFAYAVVDTLDNLENIKKAMLNKRFIKDIMGFKHSLGDKYNRKIIATFRKDFWKEFI